MELDIRRSPDKDSLLKKHPLVLIFAVVMVVIILMYVNGTPSNRSHIAYRDSLLLGQVQQGDFKVVIGGPGVLAPIDVRWISANVEGRVERILVKPGAQVTKGDLLLELSNPQLVQQMEATQWLLESEEAEVHAAEVNLESLLLDQEANTINARLNYQQAKLKLNAQQQLVDQKNGAISQLDFEQSKLATEQYFNRWQIEKKRLAKSKENLEARQKANQANLNRVRKTLQQAQRLVNNLMVRATMTSVVQAMPLELGQQVSLGSNIARLARQNALLAELKIPEMQIQQVVIGQQVIIDTHSNKVSGTVTRIDPAVVNSVVQVDVALQGELPKEARPELSIRGDVEIAFIPNATFVKRPIHVGSMSKTRVFKLDENKQFAVPVMVEFGQASITHVQILQGLQTGDEIIISDSSKWKKLTKIQIK